jgi:hypothetical protein
MAKKKSRRRSQQAGDAAEREFGKSFDKEFEQDERELERSAVRFPKVIAVIFLAVAVIALAVAVVSTVFTLRAQAQEKSATATIVDFFIRRDSSGVIVYYPVVEFYLPGERLQRVQLSEGSSSPEHVKGDDVTILYNPAQPGEARIESADGAMLNWILPGITGTLGAAFLVAALLVFWFFRRERVGVKPA